MIDALTQELLNEVSMDGLQANLLVKDYKRFVQVGLKRLYPQKHFKWNWHMDCVIDHMQALGDGTTCHTMFVMPPRHTKSTLTSQFFHPWMWLRNPSSEFITAAFAKWRAGSDNEVSQYIIKSKWYQDILMNLAPEFQYKLKRQNDEKLSNDRAGVRMAVGRGNISGQNADFVIIDDCLGSDEMYSDAALFDLKTWWTETISKRFNDPATGRFIIIGQRLNQLDIVGLIHKNEIEGFEDSCDWNRVVMPTEFELDHPTPFYSFVTNKATGKPWVDPRTKKGELLFPQHFRPEDVKTAKQRSKRSFIAQHQARPAAMDGTYFERNWFTRIPQEILPHLKTHYVLQSWDTALTEKKLTDADKGQEPAESVCTTWKLVSIKGEDQNQKYLLLCDLTAGYFRMSQLRKTAVELYDKWQPGTVLIENEVNGGSLIQDICDLGINACPFDPKKFGGKKSRAARCESIVKEGRIFVPNWDTECLYLIDAMSQFPGAGKDVTDSATQAMLWFRDVKEMMISLDPVQKKKRNTYNNEGPYITVDNKGKAPYV